MIKALGMTKGEVGWINNIFLLTMACLGIPVSYLIDRWSRKTMICIMGLVWSVGILVAGMGQGFYTVLIAMMIVGVGEAGYAPPGLPLLAHPIRPRSEEPSLEFSTCSYLSAS